MSEGRYSVWFALYTYLIVNKVVFALTGCTIIQLLAGIGYYPSRGSSLVVCILKHCIIISLTDNLLLARLNIVSIHHCPTHIVHSKPGSDVKIFFHVRLTWHPCEEVSYKTKQTSCSQINHIVILLLRVWHIHRPPLLLNFILILFYSMFQCCKIYNFIST